MTTSFAKDILPLFRPQDISCMDGQGVMIDDYAYMSDPTAGDGYADHANARQVNDYLMGAQTPRMPMGGPYWSTAQLALFGQWMSDGFAA